MGSEEFSHFFRFFSFFFAFSFFLSFFFAFLRFSSLFFVFLRFSPILLEQGKRLQFTGKMGNFTPTPSAPTPFRTYPFRSKTTGWPETGTVGTPFFSVTQIQRGAQQRGGVSKYDGKRKQTRRWKRKQTRANVDKRKQTLRRLHPPLLWFFDSVNTWCIVFFLFWSPSLAADSHGACVGLINCLAARNSVLNFPLFL